MNIFLADITSYNPGNSSVVTWRYSSGQGFDDAGTYYAPRIENPASFTRSIGGSGFGGRASSSFGELTLINNDGGLNGMATHFFDGRTLTLKYGADAVDDGNGGLMTPADSTGFTTILVATIESIAIERERVSIRLRDRSIVLDKPFSLGKYFGSNNLPYGVDGTADDLKNQPRPRVLGRVALLQPTLVNTSKLVYQVSARPNLLHHAEGGIVTAVSSTLTGFSKDKANIGVRSGWRDGALCGWSGSAVPAWISFTFPYPKTVSEIHVYTQKDAYNSDIEPYDGQTGSTYRMGSYQVQTWDGSVWVDQGSITSNTAIKRVFIFTPVTTLGIRIYCTVAPTNYAKVMEVEAYNGAAVDAILNVYDAGAYLSQSTDYTSQADMEANAPANGCWRAWPAGGCFRLGSAPYGQLSASVVERWDYPSSSAGGLIQRILTEKGFTSADWVDADFTTLGNKTCSSLGVVVDGEETTASLIDRICTSVGAWWGFDQSGKFRIARLDAPSGAAVETYTDAEILELERQADPQPPFWRAALNCDRNYAVQDRKSLAGVVPADRAVWFETENREQVKESPAVKTARLLADEVKSDTFLNGISQAAAEAQRRLDLFSARRDTVSVTVAGAIRAVDIGSTVSVTTARLGYGAGKLFTVVGISLDYQRDRADLTLWG